jgi:hypothetical protein
MPPESEGTWKPTDLTRVATECRLPGHRDALPRDGQRSAQAFHGDKSREDGWKQKLVDHKF